MGEPVQPLPDLDDESVPDDHELSPAWQAEIRRRLAEVEAGTAVLVDGAVVDAWLEDRIRALSNR